MINRTGGGEGCFIVAPIVGMAALLFPSHAFFPAFDPAGGTSATT